MSDEEPEDLLRRLDPDRAAPEPAAPRLDPASLDPANRDPANPDPAGLESAGPDEPASPARTFSPRRYQWMIGLFGIALVIAFSISELSAHGPGTAGVPAGKPLPAFAAPLAGSGLIGDANLHPPCTAADHDPRALNTCLLVARGPLVLGFFVTGSGSCEHLVDTMQAIAPRFAGVQFAAVAVRTGPAAAAKLVHRRHWTIPVAYDRDGGVGETDGVVVCPIVELVARGGTVAQRLIGKHWTQPAALAAQVRALAAR